MRTISDLEKAMTDEAYLRSQFVNEDGSKRETGKKNILFVNPQLSGKYFYKMILPYFVLRSDTVETAITFISKYSPKDQLLGGMELYITKEMVEWADTIVFPFTTQPLVYGYYNRIRELKPSVLDVATNQMVPSIKIAYNVDFNYYCLSPKHPFAEIFAYENVVNNVEDNIFYADIVFVSTPPLRNFLLKKFNEDIRPNKYDNEFVPLEFRFLPPMLDTNIIFENTDDVPDFILDPEILEGIEVKPATPVVLEHHQEVEKLIEETNDQATKVKTNEKGTQPEINASGRRNPIKKATRKSTRTVKPKQQNSGKVKSTKNADKRKPKK